MIENNNILEGQPNIKIESSQETKELEEILAKYNTLNELGNIIGLEWKKPITVVGIDSGANFKSGDTILVNLNVGIYAISGISHEAVHLILRQNNWLENETIKNFIEKYPEMQRYPAERQGYPLEQMIAYLVQEDISKPIGEKEGLEKLAETGGHKSYKKIIQREFSEGINGKVGELILNKWPEHNQSKNVIEWLESIIKEFENEESSNS